MKTKSMAVLLALMMCSMWAWAQEAEEKDTLWLANEAIGVNVIGADGDDLGNVQDIVLDRDEGRVAYLIVSYGGILGVGDKRFAVPWQAFGQTADRELSLAIDRERLADAPGFERGTLPNKADPLFHEEVHSFYNARPYSVEEQRRARADEEAAEEHAAEHDGEDWASWWDWNSWVSREDDTDWARRLDDLIGRNIENAEGETIAALNDVILDSREARVVYAVVSYGGALGFPADTAIIPWDTLRLDMEREAYVTDATVDQFEQAKLSDTEYRNLEDREHSKALHEMFDMDPFWEALGYDTETESETVTETETRTEIEIDIDTD